jgi:hypothetical protein
MRLEFYDLCFFTSIILIFFTSSCAIDQDKPNPSATSTVDIQNLVENEQYLDISAPAGWNSFKTNNPIILLIVNASEKRIVTTENFHARIFILNENGWIEIKNRAAYADNEYVLQPYLATDPTTIKALPLLPDLPDASKSYELRILVSGSTQENGQLEETVINYIDIQVFP